MRVPFAKRVIVAAIVELNVFVVVASVAVVAVVTAVVVVKSLMWDGEVINISVEMLSIGVWDVVEVFNVLLADEEMIDWEFNVSASCPHEAVKISADASLISTITGAMTGIGVGVLVDANTNVLAGAITTLEFVISELFNGFSCSAAFDCWPLALLNCDRALQAWMPSCHV